MLTTSVAFKNRVRILCSRFDSDSDLLFELLFILIRILNEMGFIFTDPSLLSKHMNCDNLKDRIKLIFGHVTLMPLPLKAHAISHGERTSELLRKIPELFGKFGVLSRG